MVGVIDLEVTESRGQADRFVLGAADWFRDVRRRRGAGHVAEDGERMDGRKGPREKVDGGVARDLGIDGEVREEQEEVEGQGVSGIDREGGGPGRLRQGKVGRPRALSSRRILDREEDVPQGVQLREDLAHCARQRLEDLFVDVVLDEVLEEGLGELVVRLLAHRAESGGDGGFDVSDGLGRDAAGEEVSGAEEDGKGLAQGYRCDGRGRGEGFGREQLEALKVAIGSRGEDLVQVLCDGCDDGIAGEAENDLAPGVDRQRQRVPRSGSALVAEADEAEPLGAQLTVEKCVQVLAGLGADLEEEDAADDLCDLLGQGVVIVTSHEGRRVQVVRTEGVDGGVGVAGEGVTDGGDGVATGREDMLYEDIVDSEGRLGRKEVVEVVGIPGWFVDLADVGPLLLVGPRRRKRHKGQRRRAV
jgi:hypothetical protein